MARPLNKKYFGNTNSPYSGGTTGIGGEGVASVTIASPIAASLAALTTTVTFSEPQISGGVRAVGVPVIDGAGDLTGINVTTFGSGYTSVPTITVVDSDNNETLNLTSGSGGVLVALQFSAKNAIKFEAQVDGTELTTGDIVKQASSRRYRVRTSDGTAVCKLVASASLNDNEMSITATDANGNTYYVTKLTAHRATLTRAVDDGSDGDWLFATGNTASWSFDAAAGLKVQIENQ